MSSPSGPRARLPFTHPADRPWFAMKPERMWTKQHDAFLHFDPVLKPRHGQVPAFRVKLPGQQMQVVRAPLRTVQSNQQTLAMPPTTSIFGSEDGEKVVVVVRIPQQTSKRTAPEAISVEEPIRTVVELPMDDVFTVRPERVTAPAAHSSLDVTEPSPSVLLMQTTHTAHPVPPAIPNEGIQRQLEPLPMESSKSEPVKPSQWSQTEIAVLRHLPTEPENDAQESPTAQPRPSHTVLPPLQTAFTPIPRSSPSFGSPFAYGPALPPGIAMNQHGVPYELATGRAVYLQPPPTMYNPQPVMHSHVVPPPFVAGHMHHHHPHHHSPDFLAPVPVPAHTSPVNGFVDPASGTPMFALPRSSRVEIRAPGDQPDGKAANKQFVRRPSGLRTTAAVFEPTVSIDGGGDGRIGYFSDEMRYPVGDVAGRHCEVVQGAAGQSQHGIDPGVIGYAFYPQHQEQQQQPYYYPEAYGYPAYMDVSQVASYEMYSPDPRAGQSTVYY